MTRFIQRVECLNESESGMWVWRGTFHSFVCIHTWHVSFMRDMTHLHAKRLIHMRHASNIRDMTHSEGGSDFQLAASIPLCAIVCNMTHSYVTWLIYRVVCGFHEGASTHLCAITCGFFAWHDSFRYTMTHSYVTWLIRTWHDSSGGWDVGVKKYLQLSGRSWDMGLFVQKVAVRCSVLQRVAVKWLDSIGVVCCNSATRCTVLQQTTPIRSCLLCRVAVCCSVCCSVLRRVAACRSMLQCVIVCCSVS